MGCSKPNSSNAFKMLGATPNSENVFKCMYINNRPQRYGF
jgi:hypothetical protein